jgi:hypothetical protein
MSLRLSRRTVVSSSLIAALGAVALPAAAGDAAPYSLPWQLRPAAATTAVRADTAFAFYDNATGASGGFTAASTLAASFKIPGTGDGWTGLAPLLKLTSVNDSPPKGTGGFAIVNPLVGANYVTSLGAGARLGLFFGVTIPVGMGGGNSPNPGITDARAAGQYARSQMDDSPFAVNDLAAIPGVDFAWVGGGLTLQAEATLFELARVRGAAVQHEVSKTNFTSGVHVGYFVIPLLSFGLDVRYQRWINAPIGVEKDTTGTLVDNWTIAIGPRLHVPLGGGVKIHPGIAYAQGLDKPMRSPLDYHIIQLDVPVTF